MLDDALFSQRLEWKDACTLAGDTIEFRPDEASPDWVTLVVETAQEGPPSPRYQQFSLLFRGPPDTVYPQGTYRFRHARLGEYAIFMTPIGRDDKAVRYDAVFTHAR